MRFVIFIAKTTKNEEKKRINNSTHIIHLYSYFSPNQTCYKKQVHDLQRAGYGGISGLV